MSSTRTQLENLAIAYASTGKFPSGAFERPELKAWAILERNADYRRAEGHARVDAKDSLSLVRALISRGSTQEAAEILRSLAPHSDGEISAEVVLEWARVYGALGDWQNVIHQATEVLRKPDVSGLSQMAAHQVRANAWLELGEIFRSSQDVQRLEAYATLYSFGQLSFYGEVLKRKIQSRIESHSSGAFVEHHQFLQEWANRAELSNADELLALLRLVLDVRRARSQSTGSLALATVAVASEMGDEIYSGLGWIDVWAAANPELREEAQVKIKRAAAAYPRVDRLWHEVQTTAPTGLTDSAKQIRRTLPDPALHSLVSPRIIHLLPLGVTAHLRMQTYTKVSLQPRMKSILQALLKGPQTKAELFRCAWGIGRYRSETHDTLIRTALRRLRDQSGLEVESKDGTVALVTGTLILDF